MSVELRQLRLPLARFTLEVDATLDGRVTAIFGASGAGKTSLLEVIAGLRRPSAGVVRIDGVTLTDAGARSFVAPERRAVGYVPQEGALFPHLSARRNLLYGFDPARPRPSGLTFDHVAAVLELSPLVDRAVGTLSGGEKQRIALGRALLAAPRLLLLDEPLAGLDVATASTMRKLLRHNLSEEGRSAVIVTHDVLDVLTLADRVVIIESGRIAEAGSTASVLAAPRSHFGARFAGVNPSACSTCSTR